MHLGSTINYLGAGEVQYEKKKIRSQVHREKNLFGGSPEQNFEVPHPKSKILYFQISLIKGSNKKSTFQSLSERK